MDSNQHRLIKSDSNQTVEESAQAGYLLFGGIVLLLGGISLLFLANASVADFGGAMLILISLALIAGSLWLYSQRPG